MKVLETCRIVSAYSKSKSGVCDDANWFVGLSVNYLASDVAGLASLGLTVEHCIRSAWDGKAPDISVDEDLLPTAHQLYHYIISYISIANRIYVG